MFEVEYLWDCWFKQGGCNANVIIDDCLNSGFPFFAFSPRLDVFYGKRGIFFIFSFLNAAMFFQKLDNWKQRRRSATLDVRQRSEERHNIMMKQTEAAAATPRRRAKTYREIVEDKSVCVPVINLQNDNELTFSLHYTSCFKL